jgi:DNA-binding LacI/PurR family transcriptional regulator
MAKRAIKGVSITDVAKKAGVSVATVSRVLNQSTPVKPVLMELVFDAASRLGYSLPERRPGPKPGRSGRKAKLGLIHFLNRAEYQAASSSTWLSLLNGVRDSAGSIGMAVEDYLLSAESAMPEFIMKTDYCGFLLAGHQPVDSAEKFLRGYPCCWLMNNPWTPTWGDHVMPDHREAGMMAAEYLIRRGCKHPVFMMLGVPDRVFALCAEGFQYAAAKLDVRVDVLSAQSVMEDVPKDYPPAVYVDEIIAQYKQLDGRPDGISFDCDHSIAVLYPVMVREKLIVPGKTVLIGCNNQQIFLKGIQPHPATMEVYFSQIGQMGVAQLNWRKANRHCQRVRSLLSPKLVALS